jgi:protein tyrosine phosphatase (PTP) superfamily phosphohydrolase (DUF442 family)
MTRKLLLGLLFVVPVGSVVLQEYWPFIQAQLWGPGVAASSTRPASQPRPRPAWATPVAAPGFRNLYRVTNDLYRGEQPDADGMRQLEAMGIRTVVNLRRFHSDDPQAAGTGLRHVHINVNPFKPREEQLVQFLRVATDPNQTPVFVHCQRGIDRTGMMCAVYRVVAWGWTKEQAIDEMTNGPFGYDAIFKNVAAFLWRLDVEELRRRVKEPK